MTKDLFIYHAKSKNHYSLAKSWASRSVIDGQISINNIVHYENSDYIRLLLNLIWYRILNKDLYVVSLGIESRYIVNLVLMLAFNKNAVLHIHNINQIFNQNRKISGIKKFIKSYYFRLLGKNANYLAVNQPFMRDHLVNVYKISTPIFVVPFDSEEKLNNLKRVTSAKRKRGSWLLAVPGMVDESRRDYSWVYEYACSNPNCDVMLLGKIRYVNSIELEKWRTLKNIKYFTDFIAEHAFNNYIQESDFIVHPLKETHDTAVSREYYGVTKDSGAFYSHLIKQKVHIYPYFLRNKLEASNNNYFVNFKQPLSIQEIINNHE